jgi:hypothetical protein
MLAALIGSSKVTVGLVEAATPADPSAGVKPEISGGRVSVGAAALNTASTQ